MRRLTTVQLPAWSLPLLALAISMPIVAAFALGGPAAGMAAGALLAAGILVIAARTRFDEEIEVAPVPRDAGHGGVLAVVTVPVEGDDAIEAIRRARGDSHGERSEVLVLAPALNSRLSHWASDLDDARLRAQKRLALSLAGLAKAGIRARGQVGDTDSVQATEDALRSFPAREVVFVTDPEAEERAVAEVRRRLDRPVTHVAAPEASSLRS